MKLPNQPKIIQREAFQAPVHVQSASPSSSISTSSQRSLSSSSLINVDSQSSVSGNGNQSPKLSPLQSPKIPASSPRPIRLEARIVTDPVNDEPGLMFEVLTRRGALVAEVYVENSKACVELVERPEKAAWDFSSEELHEMVEGLKKVLLSWKDDDAAKASDKVGSQHPRATSVSSTTSSNKSDNR